METNSRAPPAYESEPWKRYDVTNTAFQAVASADDFLMPFADQRSSTRHNIAVDMQVEVIDAHNERATPHHRTCGHPISQHRSGWSSQDSR